MADLGSVRIWRKRDHDRTDCGTRRFAEDETSERNEWERFGKDSFFDFNSDLVGITDDVTEKIYTERFAC